MCLTFNRNFWRRAARTAALCSCYFLPCSASAAEGVAAAVQRLTGARTRIVWAHQVKGEDKRWGSGAAEFALMGFDTDEGGSRVILPGPDSYANPSIAPDGSRVVFTDSGDGSIYVVNWDGTGKTRLASGFALCAWVDPVSGLQWIYAGKAEFSSPIVRFQLENPEIVETVWDEPCGPSSGFQVSADGSRAGCVSKHPSVGTIHFNDGRHATHGWGCEAGFAPDNSYRLFHMGEWVEHAGLNMYDADGANKRAVHFGKFPDSPGYDAWNPRWSTDVRFMTVSSPNAGAEQDVYLGVFDAAITRIDHWVRISHAPGQDLGAHAWIDPGLGYHLGEAPFSIGVPAPGGGRWTWEFGDGTTSEGSVARHTYQTPGAYALVGRRERLVLKGRVEVTRNAPPEVVFAGLRNERTLRIEFNESIRVESASASLASGVLVEEIEPGPAGVDILLRLAGKISNKDELKLEGVFDRAAQRNPAPASILLKRPKWPVDRKDLLLLWSGDERERFHHDPKANRFLKTQLTRNRIARIDREGVIALRGGTMVAKGAGQGISVGCREQNAFSVEAVIQPDDAAQGTTNSPRTILSCGYGDGLQRVNFALCQQASTLRLYLHVKPHEGPAAVRAVDLCALARTKPSHVVVTYAPGELGCYLNGKPVEGLPAVEGALEWQPVPYHTGLSMGAETGSAMTWNGKLERVAIFARQLGRKEAAANYRVSNRVVSSRPRVPQIHLRAKLITKSRIPSPKEIAPYADALVVNAYEVAEVLAGAYAFGTIRVAQWGLIDRDVTSLRELAPGSMVELVVEPFEMLSELKNDPLFDTLDLVQAHDSDLYVDVTVSSVQEP
jgi:hypothetical protein